MSRKKLRQKAVVRTESGDRFRIVYYRVGHDSTIIRSNSYGIEGLSQDLKWNRMEPLTIIDARKVDDPIEVLTEYLEDTLDFTVTEVINE